MMSNELFSSYGAVEARREGEIEMIKQKLEKNEQADTAVCRVERVSANSEILRLGLKRGKLLYLFKYPTHDVEREKHRNVITRARFIKSSLEHAGYRLIPWDFKKGKPPTFWDQDTTMEEEDDDLYGPSETTPAVDVKKDDSKDDDNDEQGDESMDEDSDEEDESDSDLEIIIDKPVIAPKVTPSAPQESKAIKIEAPPQPSSTSAIKSAVAAAPSVPQQPGTAYPAVRTSTIDVNADPIYPSVGKPVSQIDMDADLAESTKPWRLPGADQSDYFNYGFDEFTWEMYRQRQTDMANTLAAQKAETAQFQQMFGMPAPPTAPVQGNVGGVPGAPTGPAAQNPSGGMPSMPQGMPGGGMPMSEDQLAMMMQQMQAQGMDMSNMDFSQFMQMAGIPGMGGGFGGQQQQQQQQQQGNQGGGGGRGQGRRGGRGW